MATYKLTAREILAETIEVEADSEQEAVQKVYDMLHDGDFVVDCHQEYQVEAISHY